MAVCVGCGLTEEDNVLDVQPRTSGGIFCDDTTNELRFSLAESAGQNFIATLETTTSEAYTDLATVGPTVSILTGTQALVMFDAEHSQTGSGGTAAMSVAVSGATTIAASDNYAFNNSSSVQFGWAYGMLITGLTPGTNIFTAKYRTVGAGTVRFANRRLIVVPA